MDWVVGLGLVATLGGVLGMLVLMRHHREELQALEAELLRKRQASTEKRSASAKAAALRKKAEPIGQHDPNVVGINTHSRAQSVLDEVERKVEEAKRPNVGGNGVDHTLN